MYSNKKPEFFINFIFERKTTMLNFNNETSRNLVLHAYNMILDMLSYDNLYDYNNYQNITAKINEIKYMKPFMPTSIFEAFTSFIEDHIVPIIENESALKEFQTEEFGFTNDDGEFVFTDDMRAKLFVGRVMQHCKELQEKFIKMAMFEIRPYFQ